jgi:lipid-A-disaccharide synthase
MAGKGRGPRIAIVAGEPSGDLLGSLLVAAIQRLVPNAEFRGIAGPRMQALGVASLFPMQTLAVRGYVEVLRHFREIVGIRSKLRRQLLADPPDLFIGVDAPDFNLSLETALRRAGVPTAHFVSPSIWAWRPERMQKIRAAVSHMLALFPFEAPLYERAGVPVTFVGHPLADLLADAPGRTQARDQLRLPADAVIVALLPGSRVSELEQLADTYVQTARIVADRRGPVIFLVPLVNRETRLIFEAALDRAGARDLPMHLLFGHAHEAMSAADVVLVASGTATLEAALLARPMVICYRMPALSWRIMRRKKLLPYVGLPNILAGQFVVPELIQDDATPENLAQVLCNLLADPVLRQRMSARLGRIRQDLQRDSAATAARALLPYLTGTESA